ncbi:MAG: ATP-dependent Clp protease ATP-binding subunit ClpC [Pseudonocardiales bacterium]|nr:ATP-dependent Clp protease ATP-binding subunit ClpC [Pseudonocardiales bacterium]
MPEEPFEQGFNPLEVLVKGLIDGLESIAGPFGPDPEPEPDGPPPPGARRPRPRRPTPTLDRYGQDLTDAARRGRLDPVIGRDHEVGQVLEVLSRRTKNNPVLIGDPGVGKTAIVEGIAARVAAGDVPETLRGRRIVALDLAGLVAGTRYRGDFEQRLTAVIDEVVAADREVVLFLDELHTVIGAGGAEGAPMDAGSMLKPALARGGLQLIGATTVEEYRRHIERDGALERRFQPILVGEPSVTDTIGILLGLRDRYESHHRVRITEAAVEAAARLSDRYLTDRFLPDKAIDLIDRAAARVRMGTPDPGPDPVPNSVPDSVPNSAGSETPEVSAEHVAEVVAQLTGIPVAQLTAVDRQRLLRLEELLGERVVGQRDAVQAVADAVRAGRAGLTHPDRPVGSFLFLGPTGVGKTELARALASALFGAEDRLVRFDMSEFGDRHTVSRLVGAPPGYVGHDEAGQLTDAVRRTPYTVVLLDEIEKAHPDVTNILLQVLDAGRLTDARGRTANFTNTVVILTSNIGADALLAATAAGRAAEDIREPLMAGVRGHFRPEFLNRIDEIVLFAGLGQPELRAITELLLAQTRERLRAQGIELRLEPDAVDWLAERGHQPEFGARPLRRTIARELERQLSRLLIGGELVAGQLVVGTVAPGGDGLDLAVTEPVR